MAKKDNRPMESMKLTIEFADNGIILRNPDMEDDVTLALTRDENDHSEEYKAIGRKVYDWLTEVVVEDHSTHYISTGADLYILATLNGRYMY